MDSSLKIGRYPFYAETFLVDSKGRVRLAALCRQMLTCGGAHAEARGFGATSTLGWVIARLAVKIERMPKWRENYYIETWTRNLYHGFTDRCFRVVDEDGEIIASALSTYALMNLETRSSVDLNGDIGQRLVECMLPDEAIPLRRIPAINRTPVEEVSFRRRPQYSDVDINGHMNSIRTLEHIIDYLPLEYLNTHTATDLVINYMQEGEAAEELSYGIKKLEDNHFVAQVTKENGVAASRCEFVFKEGL